MLMSIGAIELEFFKRVLDVIKCRYKCGESEKKAIGL